MDSTVNKVVPQLAQAPKLSAKPCYGLTALHKILSTKKRNQLRFLISTGASLKNGIYKEKMLTTWTDRRFVS